MTKIITLENKRSENGAAIGTRCQCATHDCRDKVLYYNGKQKAVAYGTGFVGLGCAVKLGLITRDEAMEAVS